MSFLPVLECQINIILNFKDTVLNSGGFLFLVFTIGKKFLKINNTYTYTEYSCQALQIGVVNRICAGKIALPLFSMVVSLPSSVQL